MITPEKIEEWLQEARERPESAGLMLKYIADRLQELERRNEQLLAENIALQSGTRIEEYKKHIDHLEYELGLLKRILAGGEVDPLKKRAIQRGAQNLLVYNARGQILRLEMPASPDHGELLGTITGELVVGEENPRLLPAQAGEELLFLFSSGRVAVHPLESIPTVSPAGTWDWKEGTLLDEPRGGELLVCLAPASALPLAENFLQTSRRGCVKKTMAAMCESILSNRFLGRGILQKRDQAFDLLLSSKGARLLMVTHEGRLLVLEVDPLSYAAEERIQLDGTDHVVATLLVQPQEDFLVLTQTGKVIQRQVGQYEPARSGQAHGHALLSPSRLAQGLRLIGALPAAPGTRVAVLQADGQLTLLNAAALAGAGALPTEAGLVACGAWTDPAAIG